MNPGRTSGLFQCLPPQALKQSTMILFQIRSAGEHSAPWIACIFIAR